MQKLKDLEVKKYNVKKVTSVKNPSCPVILYIESKESYTTQHNKVKHLIRSKARAHNKTGRSFSNCLQEVFPTSLFITMEFNGDCCFSPHKYHVLLNKVDTYDLSGKG
jgi:hypothetical protein